MVHLSAATLPKTRLVHHTYRPGPLAEPVRTVEPEGTYTVSSPHAVSEIRHVPHLDGIYQVT